MCAVTSILLLFAKDSVEWSINLNNSTGWLIHLTFIYFLILFFLVFILAAAISVLSWITAALVQNIWQEIAAADWLNSQTDESQLTC